MTIIELLDNQFKGCEVKITNDKGAVHTGMVKYFYSVWDEYHADAIVCEFEDSYFTVEPEDKIELL